MTAWVLIIYMNSQFVYSVSNIETEYDCKRLLAEISKASTISPPGSCFSYRAAYRF